MSEVSKGFVIGVLALMAGGLMGWGAAGAAGPGKANPQAAAPSQEMRVKDTLGRMGFAVESARAVGEGRWEVRVKGFDPGRAVGAFRGVIAAPAATSLGGGHAAATREGGKLGPRGVGGTRSAEDGSATGGGNSGPPESSSGGGRGGGPLPGADGEGGSATGGGGGGEPEGGTTPRARSQALRVSIGADGALEIDAAGLRQAGWTPTVGATADGQVRFREGF